MPDDVGMFKESVEKGVSEGIIFGDDHFFEGLVKSEAFLFAFVEDGSSQISFIAH